MDDYIETLRRELADRWRRLDASPPMVTGEQALVVDYLTPAGIQMPDDEEVRDLSFLLIGDWIIELGGTTRADGGELRKLSIAYTKEPWSLTIWFAVRRDLPNAERRELLPLVQWLVPGSGGQADLMSWVEPGYDDRGEALIEEWTDFTEFHLHTTFWRLIGVLTQWQQLPPEDRSSRLLHWASTGMTNPQLLNVCESRGDDPLDNLMVLIDPTDYERLRWETEQGVW